MAELARKAQSALNSVISDLKSVEISDPVYNASSDDAESINHTVRELHLHVKQLHDSVESLAEAQKLVAKDLKKLYKGDTTSQEVVRDFTRTARSLADDLPGRMLPILDTSVVAAAATWSERLNAVMLEAQSESVVESYKKFKHYDGKVAEMQTDKRAGKMTTDKQKEAYERNQDKLQGAREGWEQHRDKVVSSMNLETNARFDEVNKIMLRMIQFTQAFYQQGNDIVAGLTQAKGLVDALVRQPPVRVCVAVEPVGDSADGAEDAEDGLASPASNVDFQPVLASGFGVTQQPQATTGHPQLQQARQQQRSYNPQQFPPQPQQQQQPFRQQPPPQRVPQQQQPFHQQSPLQQVPQQQQQQRLQQQHQQQPLQQRLPQQQVPLNQTSQVSPPLMQTFGAVTNLQPAAAGAIPAIAAAPAVASAAAPAPGGIRQMHLQQMQQQHQQMQQQAAPFVNPFI